MSTTFVTPAKGRGLCFLAMSIEKQKKKKKCDERKRRTSKRSLLLHGWLKNHQLREKIPVSATYLKTPTSNATYVRRTLTAENSVNAL